MKQILQNLKTGKMELADLPCPAPSRGMILIQNRASLISAGTERMLVEFSKGNLLQKARSQPDKVKQVLDKIKTDGLMPTLEAVFNKLDEPMPLGYCSAGVVLEVGPGVTGIQPGDRVASNGPHAEVVCVPHHLCAKVPDGVSDEAAAFTVLSSIALQGIRLVQPALGERVMVFGLGLIGLVTVQLLRANGCAVLGVDFNKERLQLAEDFGAQTVDLAAGGDPIKAALAWSGGVGVDASIITASAKTDDIMHQAAEACRKRGRIVLVGVVGLNLRRDDFYKKELSFQVSCSYGPGRYDEAYEQGGQDYPLGYVRWTEQRNLEAVLGTMQSGMLNVEPLITHRFAHADAIDAYDKIQNDSRALGVVLRYPEKVQRSSSIAISTKPAPPSGSPVVGVIGAGGFAKAILLPALARTQAHMKYLADLNPAAAQHGARKFGMDQAITDYRQILDDKSVHAVFVAVGHHLHARFVIEALKAGKHVFVEKPLAMNQQELDNIVAAAQQAPDRFVMVGFNRRFSPHTTRIRQMIAGRSEPLCLNMTVNAGFIPPEHWTQDPQRGGGRIIGEACHFMDLLSHIAGSRIETVAALMAGEDCAVRTDRMSIALGFADGSVGTVNYFANGSKSYPKERLEVFCDGRVLHLENFRQTVGYGFKGFKRFKTWRQDKGHQSELAAYIKCIAEGGEPLIPLSESVNATQASFAAMESAQMGHMVRIPKEEEAAPEERKTGTTD